MRSAQPGNPLHPTLERQTHPGGQQADGQSNTAIAAAAAALESVVRLSAFLSFFLSPRHISISAQRLPTSFAPLVAEPCRAWILPIATFWRSIHAPRPKPLPARHWSQPTLHQIDLDPATGSTRLDTTRHAVAAASSIASLLPNGRVVFWPSSSRLKSSAASHSVLNYLILYGTVGIDRLSLCPPFFYPSKQALPLAAGSLLAHCPGKPIQHPLTRHSRLVIPPRPKLPALTVEQVSADPEALLASPAP